MTITLEVPGDVAQRLAHEASRLGLSVDQFVLRAALGQLDGPPQHGSTYGLPSHDPYLTAAGARAKAAAQELETLGITDNRGNRLRTDLPEDMREGADRDFGG
ncbi:MAG TPA: hypothetical protein DEH78_29140 [Solibacterales bacterium]|nr:hypothetical protein [Bryobacterales bacterium]